MAVTLLEIARTFATKVPGKIDADVLQLLWKVGLHIFNSHGMAVPIPLKINCDFHALFANAFSHCVPLFIL